jgi:hypothetical protein
MQQSSLVTSILLSVVVLAVVTIAISLASKNVRGSLVVAIVSPKADYVVVAAESRNTNAADLKPVDDDACKIISLDGETLFFETGESYYRSQKGDRWDARTIARTVYSKSKNHDAHALSLAWAKAVQEWFARLPAMEIRSVTGVYEGEFGKIGTGSFVAFGTNGIPVVDGQSLDYSFRDRTFRVRPEFTSPRPGQFAGSGLGLDLVTEFLMMKSQRAISARGLDAIGRDPMIDSRIAAGAIRFAEDHFDGPEKSQLGGPIDVALLRKNQAVEWVSRKDECYQYDLKSSATKSGGSGQAR